MKHILSFVLPGAIIVGALLLTMPSAKWNIDSATPQGAQVATSDTAAFTLIGDADTITQTSARLNATPQWWKYDTNTEKKFSQFEVDFPNGSTKTYAYGYYSDIFYHTVTGLVCNTKYPYRAATLNTSGSPYYSGTKYFTTLPCSANNPVPQIDLSANPNPVQSGKNTTITLLTKNAVRCSSSDIGGREIGINGNFEAGPITKNTTYEVTCQNAVGDFKTESITIMVVTTTNINPRVISFSAVPSVVKKGESATLSWKAEGVNNCNIDGILAKRLFDKEGSTETGALSQTKTYTISCANDVGVTASKSVIVTVTDPISVSVAPVITSFTVAPNVIQGSGNVSIAWSSTNTNGCTIAPFTGSASSGIRTDFVNATKTYTLVCYGVNAQVIEESRTVTVTPGTNNQTVQINDVRASPNPVFAGNPSVISWSTTYANSCQLDSETVALNGSRTVNLYSSRQYTLVCTGLDGQAVSSNVFIHVDSNNGSNGGGSNQPPVIGNLSISPLTVSQGAFTTIYWNSDADYCTASGAWSGQKNASGSERVGPVYSNQTYTLTCYKNGRSTSQSVTAFTQTTNFETQNTNALTSVPTRVRTQNADLNGIALIGNGLVTQGWFEWGSTRDLGNRTNAQLLGSNRTVDFTETISGLSPNTQYFYRAVVKNNDIMYRGDIVLFSTERLVANTQTTFVRQPVNTVRPITQTRVIAAQARAVTPNPASTLQSQTYGRPVFIELTTTQVSPQVTPNTNVEYRIQYRNITGTLLTNTVIKVVLPEEFEYVSATRGMYSVENRTLTLFLGDIQPREENTFTVLGRVLSTAQIGKTVVVTGYANYTIPKTNQFIEYQDEVIAYTLSLIQAGNGGGVSQVAGVGATGNTFWISDIGRAFAWLLLFLILLIILYLIRRIHKTFKEN